MYHETIIKTNTTQNLISHYRISHKQTISPKSKELQSTPKQNEILSPEKSENNTISLLNDSFGSDPRQQTQYVNPFVLSEGEK